MDTMLAVIHVTDTTDLTELLDKAASEPLMLERNGVRFCLRREANELRYDPDPERVRAMLAAVAGSWADVDVDEMIRDIYEAREAGSRPFDRP